MNSVLERFRTAARRAAVGTPDSGAPPRYQGYIDERSTRHVAGWVRNLDDANERVTYEVVLASDGAGDGAGDGGDFVLHSARANAYSDILVQVGVGDGAYAFRVLFDRGLTEDERDRVFVRPRGSAHRLELAPELRTQPPGGTTVAHAPDDAPARAGTAGPFQGYIDERSVEHVAGWIRDLGDEAARVSYEIVVPTGVGERVLARGRADAYSPVLKAVGVGEGDYSFYALLSERLTPAQRDAVFVRPAGSAHRLELAPGLRTRFEPISHLAMDIVNNCNLRCPFCVYDYTNTRATRFMDDATFDSALRLIPYVTDGNFWLSCLHEATLHPRLIEFIDRVPAEHRHKLFYTTNLAKRMPDSYFAFLAQSGMHHLNVSVESMDPAIYERMRKGARHRIFLENWAKLLACFSASAAPPRLRYNLMAYRSNLREIPALVETLRRDKMAWQVEVRHTFDEPHIPGAFRDSEFLTSDEWSWLAGQLAGYSKDEVLLLLPPGGVGYDRDLATVNAAAAHPVPPQPLALTDAGAVDAENDDSELSPAPGNAGQLGRGEAYKRIPRPLNLSMDWDGTMRVYGEEPRGPGEAPTHVNYLMTNIRYLKDPLRFLLAL
jgi:hypothetical protein